MARKFFHDYFVTIFCSLAGAFFASGFVWALIALSHVASPSLILHFNDIGGITSLGGIGSVVFIGCFGALVLFMDFAIAREFLSRDRFFARLVSVLALVLGILLFIGFVAIINANV